MNKENKKLNYVIPCIEIVLDTKDDIICTSNERRLGIDNPDDQIHFDW